MDLMPILTRIQIVALVALAFPLGADACTCVIEPLAARYERASIVFVARVAELQDNYAESGTRSVGWSFSTIEALKGDVTFDKLVPDGCGGRVVEGVEYLIFTDSKGQVGPCTSGQLNQDERFRADLEVLRSYRNGNLQTISEPWVFTKRLGKCGLSLDMALGHGSLMFEYRFADADTRHFRDQQFRYDINEHRTVKLEGVGSHPAHFAGFRRLRIWYPYSHYKVEGTGRLTIGSKEWPTEYQHMEAPISPFEVVSDSAFADVLAAAKSHDGLGITAEYKNFPYNLKDYPDFPVIKTATPQFYLGTAIENFEKCIDQAGQ
jgi:hypothetical protein